MQQLPCINYTNVPPDSNNGTGQLIVSGLNPAISFEFLSKVWAQQRRRIRKNYGVGVVATFKRGDKDEIIISFIRNGAYASRHNIDKRLYKKRFEETFKFWVLELEDILEKISIDIFQGISEEEIIHSCFPEKRLRQERQARKATEKAAKAAKNKILKTNQQKCLRHVSLVHLTPPLGSPGEPNGPL